MEVIEIFKKTGKVKTWLEYAYDLGYNNSSLTNKQMEDKARKALSKYNSSEGVMKIAKYTHRDENGCYTTYVSDNNSLPQVDYTSKIKELNLKATIQKVKPNHVKSTVINLADLHYGLLEESYSPQETEYRLQSIINEVNSMGYAEVYLSFLGDFAESFSGLNKQDTWKRLALYESSLVLSTYELLIKLVSNIFNIKGIYIVSGNHDRYTPHKEISTKDSYLKVVAYFLQKELDKHKIEVIYSDDIITKEIDNIQYIFAHGDKNFYRNINSFILEHGSKDKFNLLLTGHLHEYRIVSQSNKYIHIQCPSIVGDTNYSTSVGFKSLPGYIQTNNTNGLPQVIFNPIQSK